AGRKCVCTGWHRKYLDRIEAGIACSEEDLQCNVATIRHEHCQVELAISIEVPGNGAVAMTLDGSEFGVELRSHRRTIDHARQQNRGSIHQTLLGSRNPSSSLAILVPLQIGRGRPDASDIRLSILIEVGDGAGCRSDASIVEDSFLP